MKKLVKIQAIVYRKKNNSYEYLALKRNESIGDFWQPVTGGKKEGETIDEALERELKEELGNGFNIKKIIKNVHYFEFNKQDNSEKNHVKEYVFGVEVSENSQIKLSKEAFS